MGQSEDCRAQFVIWSSVVSAYCTTPFVPSWDASGVSCRARVMGGGVPAAVETMPGPVVRPGPAPREVRPGCSVASWAVAGLGGEFEIVRA